MLVLQPRNYKLNGKWSLIPQNRIDSVNVSIITNEIAETDEKIHTESFDVVKIGDRDYTLPISNNITPTYFRWMHNKYWRIIQGTSEYAKARVECVMATGSRTFTLEKAIKGVPTVSLNFVGKSSIITRGEGRYSAFPSIDDLKNKDYSLATWIESNKNSSSTNPSWQYEDSKLSMNPWVYKVIPTITYEDGRPAYKAENIPLYADICTQWANQDESFSATSHAHFDGWSEGNNIGSKAKKVYMLSPDAHPDYNDFSFAESVALQIADINIPLEVSIVKNSDYNFTVKWSAPVRFAYLAASQNSDFTGDHEDVDNWAFVDNIERVEVTLSGKPYSEETQDTIYTLDANNKVAKVTAVGDYPINVNDSELLTIKTSIKESINWAEYLSTALLRQFQKGKYIIELDVRASWALKNNVSVNTQMQLCLPDGTLLKRQKTVAIFEVKNIEKIFDQNEFIFKLKLMEV